MALALGLGLMTLTVVLLTSTGQAAASTQAATSVVVNTSDAGLIETLLQSPAQQSIHPPRNSVTATLATTVSITYDEAISATTVTSQTFAVHGMQSGLVTETHGVVNGNTIIVTPTNGFFPGELVYAIATTQTTNLDGTHPVTPTLWQFNAGNVTNRCVGGFTNINAGLPAMHMNRGGAVWGDYDNDGDLDILLTGYGLDPFAPATEVYRNDGGSFTNINAGLDGVHYSSAAWGDYDNDGDLDILLAGQYESNATSWIYRNDDGAFTDISAGLTGSEKGSVDWGDYDNDGDLDILLAGYDGSDPVSQIYRNNGNGTFTDISAGLTAMR